MVGYDDRPRGRGTLTSVNVLLLGKILLRWFFDRQRIALYRRRLF